VLAFLIIFSLFVSQICPIILDIVLPINGSRLRRLHITAEYFLDQEKYFFFILFHMDTAVFISKIALVATGTMFITYLYHTCGMFNIARYKKGGHNKNFKLANVLLITLNRNSKNYLSSLS
jgi:hypothetical protein